MQGNQYRAFANHQGRLNQKGPIHSNGAEIASVKADTVEIKERLRSHDASIIELRRADVHAFEDQARQQVSIDALTRRIESIESRLELI